MADQTSSQRRGPETGLQEPPDPEIGDGPDTGEEDAPRLFLGGPRRIIQTTVLVVLLVVAIYVLVPQLLDLDAAFSRFGRADTGWIIVAFGFAVLTFGGYVAMFRGIVGRHVIHLTWSESYQITMAGLAATRLFSAGGAGGIVLTYWALRKRGLERRRSAQRMVTFLVVMYAVYMLALVLFGILLRTGVLPGPAPVSVTLIPTAIAGGVMILFLLFALIPSNLDGRWARWAGGSGRSARIAGRLGSIPATVGTGTRGALKLLRNPRVGALAVGGAIAFWGANIGILWATFNAFDVQVPVGVLVQGFFVGMAANLFPFAPGGVGAVDAGMIGAFAIFGLPGPEVFAAVLWYRVLAFWLPIAPGVVAYFQLRRTVDRWQAEGRRGSPYDGSRPAAA